MGENEGQDDVRSSKVTVHLAMKIKIGFEVERQEIQMMKKANQSFY